MVSQQICGLTLDPDQHAAAIAPIGPLMILAGAGTGKTTTITARIAYGLSNGRVKNSQILAVTFTTKAAAQLRARITKAGLGDISAVTFHSAAFRQLKYFYPMYQQDIPWKIIENKFSVLSGICAQYQIKDYDVIKNISGEIDWAKSMGICAADYPVQYKRYHRNEVISVDLLHKIYENYEEYKEESHQVDFHDLLGKMIQIFTQRQDLLTIFQQRYRSFVIDEYQDVNPLQQQLLDLWLGQRDDITIVGDANQTIYSFTGASSSYLLNFPRRYENAQIFRLVRDYRSTKPIVNLANTLISGLYFRPPGTRLQLEGQRSGNILPEITSYPDDHSETQAIVAQCARKISAGILPEEIAILYRNNISAARFEHELFSQDISYTVHDSSDLYGRKEVQKLITVLIRLVNSEPAIAHSALLQKISAAFSLAGYTAKPPTEEEYYLRWEVLDDFYARVQKIYRESNGTGRDFISLLRRRTSKKTQNHKRAIVLSSIHAAKGLEWDAVFIVGIHDGILPSQQAIDLGNEGIDEERRLLYVAVTRARQWLHLSYSLRRYEKSPLRKPSRFLRDISAKKPHYSAKN